MEIDVAPIFERVIDNLGFDGYASVFMYLFSFVLPGAITASRLFGKPMAGERRHSSSLLFEVIVFLIMLTVSHTIFRHTSILLEMSVEPYEFTLVLLLMVTTLFCAIDTFRSLYWAITLSSIITISGFFRFLDPANAIYSEVVSWFEVYFPYDISPATFSTGVATFVFFSTTSLFFLQSANRRRKERMLKNEDIGIDPAAIEKLSFLFAAALGLIVAMLASGVNLPTITLVSGAIAAGAGFAARDVLSNIAAGVLLLWDGSLKAKDVISIDNGGYGWIERLTIRHAVIKDRNDMSILIPYTKLINSTIQNWTHDENKVRLKIDIGIGYETDDIVSAKEVILNAARSVDRVLPDPAPRVLIVAAGASAIQMQLRFWIDDPDQGIRNVMSDVLERMIEGLRSAEIAIPFDQLDLHLRSLPDTVDPPNAEGLLSGRS